MTCDLYAATVTEQEVTYTTELDGKLIVIEHVPVKVCGQCGQKLFSADTVDNLQSIAWAQKEPCRILETPIFDFAGNG